MSMSIILAAACIIVSSELYSSDRIGQQGKRTSDQARTRDLRSIAEFQPREPSILRPQLPLSTGVTGYLALLLLEMDPCGLCRYSHEGAASIV